MQIASPTSGSQLALVQLPGRMRRAIRLFRRITGHTAVTSIAASLPEPGRTLALSPPVHPRCAKKLRSIPNPPCSGQWLIHVRSSRRSAQAHTHTCPIGLRCSCVPIHFGDQLVGVAKLVVDADTPDAALRTAVSVLKLVVSETCQDSAVSVLSEEVRTLRQWVTELQRIESGGRSRVGDSPALSVTPVVTKPDAQGAAFVHRALAHLRRHFQDPTLSLQTVAGALGCNRRYLTARFTKIVGEHMHRYLITLRVSHACRLLMTTDSSIKAVAYASGFSAAGRLTNAFRHHVGVSPSEYRRIFANP